MHYKMRKDGNLNDVILILQMKQGDEQAFDKFVRKYYGDILSYCKYHCLDQTEAEDLTQETFLRFMNNIQSYQHIGKAKNYLYVIAGNLCKNHVKKWKADCVEKEVLERKLISDGGIPKQEKQIYVKQALEQMNPELKEIIIMFYFQDFKLIRSMIAGKRVKELLEQVGLAKSVNKKMKKLSGGMKRRAGIAQAMLNNPKILILDEPTAGLDPTERVRFRNLISELSEERIVILSTHIVSDVEYIANEIWLMKEGQIVQQGDLDHMLASMQENVYACEVLQVEATKMMKQFKVSNMKAERGMVELRIIADQPPIHGASVVEPTLEDVFLYYFGEKGGEME